MEQTCNPILWAKVQEIWSALERPDPTFHVHFCGNTKPMVSTQQDRVRESLEDYNSFEVHHHSLDSIVQMFLERKKPKIDAELRAVDKNYFERSDGNIRGIICTFEANEIVKLITDPEDEGKVRHDAFNDNVRVYLTKRNAVNKKIYETALSDESSEFWYLNNGITMTCDSFSYIPGRRSPKISLTNVQIVNGGQTSNALFEAHLNDPDKLENVLVLGRIYETRNRDITSKIAEATNSQTPINTRDLHSNDDIQKKLEESFRDLGLFYERKARQHSKEPKNKRIDALSAGQSHLAYSHGLPEVAKKDRARVFRDLYGTIFNNEVTPQQLLVSLRIYDEIQIRKRTLQKKIRNKEKVDASLLFLIDGGYHVLFAVHELCEVRGIDPYDLAEARKFIPAATDIVKTLVKDEMADDETFTTNRFFKDLKTKTKIQRLVLAEAPKKKVAKKTRARTRPSENPRSSLKNSASESGR
ncbi:hypothetical protein Hsar01_01815 [Haloferula sargassicola]|uniref:Abortive phage infection protein C-terminal domain-containing protein n=2 Tax=Haloferula sargassicola TaxID=490096 RepID=A0ABP9UMG0_9BACT